MWSGMCDGWLESGRSSVLERARGVGEVGEGCCEGVLFVAMSEG